MVDTGIRVRRVQRSSYGVMLSVSLCLGIVALVLGADFYLNLMPSSVILSPLLFCFAGVVILGNIVVPILQELKAGQIVREDGPKAHLQKTGTPTMGGIMVIPVGVVTALMLSGFNSEVVAASLVTLAYSTIGWLDDLKIIRYDSNKGISPLTKLLLQALPALGFCGWLSWMHPIDALTSVALPLHLVLPLGALFFPLAIFVFLGSSNATNVTDGLDGLAAGTGAIALAGLALLIGDDHTALVTFLACMSGSFLGFLWHNRYPAKVFMGNTGSLGLGGALAAAAILGNMLWGLAIVGGIFVWESISVIAQVGYFKYTKRNTGIGQRLFKMAPYHHHLELSGWREIQVVGAFYITGMILAVVAIALKLL